MTDPAPPPDPTVAWNKVQVYLDRLVHSIQELDAGGGLEEAARRANWKPSKLDKAAASLKTTRDALDATIARLKSTRGGGPRR